MADHKIAAEIAAAATAAAYTLIRQSEYDRKKDEPHSVTEIVETREKFQALKVRYVVTVKREVHMSQGHPDSEIWVDPKEWEEQTGG